MQENAALQITIFEAGARQVGFPEVAFSQFTIRKTGFLQLKAEKCGVLQQAFFKAEREKIFAQGKFHAAHFTFPENYVCKTASPGPAQGKVTGFEYTVFKLGAGKCAVGEVAMQKMVTYILLLLDEISRGEVTEYGTQGR